MNKSEILLSPIKIGTRDCQNRFFSQAMECNDADADGNPTDLTYQRYEKLFKGEAGLVSLEAITITDKNRSRMNQLFIMPKNQVALANFVNHERFVAVMCYRRFQAVLGRFPCRNIRGGGKRGVYKFQDCRLASARFAHENKDDRRAVQWLEQC